MSTKSPQSYKKILGLDIGSSKVTACLCDVGSEGDVHTRGLASFPSIGIVKGKIEYPDELKRAIRKAIQRAELTAGSCAEHVIATLPFYSIESSMRTGSIQLPDPYLPITEKDKMDCLRQSKSQDLSVNETILHIIPIVYRVDGVSTHNPIGLTGKHLEADTHILTIKTAIIDTLSTIFNDLSLHISGLLYEPLAAAHVYLDEHQREKGAYIIDCGGRFTKVSFFQNHLLQKTVILPIGGDTITGDIAYCLKIPMVDAERLKTLYGDLRFSHMNPQEKIRVSPSDTAEVNRRMFCQIIEARVAEMIGLLQKKMSFHMDLRHDCVLVGGSHKLGGFQAYLEETLGHPVRSGFTPTLESFGHPTDHASALGCILYGVRNRVIPFPKSPHPDILARFNQWVHDFF